MLGKLWDTVKESGYVFESWIKQLVNLALMPLFFYAVWATFSRVVRGVLFHLEVWS